MEHGGHHEEGHGPPDPMGKRIAVMASVLAVLLAVVTILSHREHTSAVMEKSEENDKWGEYQAKKIKMHELEVGVDLITLMVAKSEPSDKKVEAYKEEIKRYGEESKEISKQAKEKEAEVKRAEARAAYFDLGEGLLEIGLVMSSLYFLGKKVLFPVVGGIAGLSGVVVAIMGLMK